MLGYDCDALRADTVRVSASGAPQKAPNGVVWQRFGYLGNGSSTPFTNGLAYMVDGEGRLNGLWDGTAQKSVWWGTTYNAASQPDYVKFYSGDQEGFQWDVTTGRMTSWTSTAGSQQQTGTLTWNVNGTLNQMVISDTANPSNNQTCLYGYDDLSRLLSANCGSAWSQTFSYDTVGNIAKSGSSNFSSLGGTGNHVPGFGYDANGDVTNDGANTYAYNVEGRPMTVNGYGQIFDAFDRLVESQNAGGYTSIVYSPDGYKLALMHGSAVVKYMAPLAAGMQAVYTANTPAGVAYWRHADWLGSSRLATTVGQTVYYDGAYAPFGESYAETGTTDRSFTGQTQDTTPGLYDFLYRQQSSAQGRWLVPDPAGLAAVDITNPQTWNRYAYVGNNPLSYIDPVGLYCAIAGDYGHFSVGCGDVGMAWGSGIFPQWVPPTATSSITTDPNDPTMQTFTISHTTGYWMMGLPLSSVAMLSGSNGNGLPKGAKVPWIFNVIVSTPEEPVGPAVTVAYNPATTNLCLGGGLGVSEGKNASLGFVYPVPGTGGFDNLDNVLSGVSVSWGYNFKNTSGYQWTGNFSGHAAGPTIGVPGAGGAVTVSGCINVSTVLNLAKSVLGF